MQVNKNQLKSFFKKTRKGNVIRITNDKYIRNDLGYGFLFGKTILSKESFLDIVTNAVNKLVIIIDTNVALHQIDVLDFKCPGTSVVIILQTVLQELKHLNLSVYRRLVSLLQDETRYYIFYANEMSTETSLQREFGETINDANDRSIRNATKFYNSVLDGHGSVCLITNDKANQNKAVIEGINSMSMREYVSQYLHDNPELLDLLSANTYDDNKEEEINHSAKYLPHLSSSEISIGIKSKRFFRGVIRCKDSWMNGYVIVHTNDSEPRKSITLVGESSINRAVDGDVVAVEIISHEEVNTIKSKLKKTITNIDNINIGDDVAEPSIEILEGLPDQDNKNDDSILYGRVVGIIRRNWRLYAGSIDTEGKTDKFVDSDGGTSVLFLPIDAKIPPVRLVTRRRDELVGNRLLVAIDSWPNDSIHPHGHYSRILGKSGDKDVETQILLHEFDVPHEAFTKEVMGCLPPADWSITEDIVKERSDFRHIPIVSIDPPGCKDIDDALHAIELANGNYEIGVHIADVTYFVHPDSALDKEAAHRSTSTYLVERRLDMLPGLLTTQLCSLRSNEDHLAFSTLWEMTPEGSIVNVNFCKSVIRSVASLTYDEAQAMLDDASCTDQISKSVKLLNRFARILRQNRIDEGALTLASPEVRFKLDVETQNPTDVSMYALKEANALVEEWMLLANITVSKKILRHYPTLAVLRRHQPPSRQQFAPLLSAAASVGVYLDISSSKALADSLDAAVRPDDPYFNKLLRILSTRCMMPAQYFCSGEIPKDQWHHYGLAAPVYTHFTSPIRRYPDIIVHRLLAACIGVSPLPAGNADRSRQQDLCSHMNRRHKAAQHAQRASVKLHTLIFFKSKPSNETAYVFSISNEKMTVLIPRFGIESSIEFEQITKALNGIVSYNESSHKVDLYDAKTSKLITSFQVFQPVQVNLKVKEKNGGNRILIVSLIHDGKILLDDNDNDNEHAMDIDDNNNNNNNNTSSSNNNKRIRETSTKAVDRKKKK